MAGPLEGIRVLELAGYITGPFAGQVLADFGAEVIKVEPPGSGDPFRRGGGGDGARRAYSASYVANNRSKRSLTLDLKSEAAADIFKRLVARSDVLVQNYRPGVAERLGVDYERVREINSRIIYCSISGFGQSGPYARRPSYNEIGQALSGLWRLMLNSDSLRPPGPAISDPLTGMYAAQVILAALFSRERTGLGQHVDTSMLEATIGFIVEPYSAYFSAGQIVSNRFERSQAYAFYCADGLPMTIHLSSPPKFWHALLKVIGREDLADDPRFVDKHSRDEHYDLIHHELENVMATRPRSEWLDLLQAVDVPCAPINTVQETMDDPQVKYLGIHKVVEHPVEGTLDVLSYPGRFSETPLEPPTAPPTLGEQTEEILASLGYDSDEIRRFGEGRVI
jgi:crotonobetainyl-CoA:carnitine CoA-transferase CaiB-like acyl-CoA transferase